jgi:hypothetical protein
MTGLRVGWLVAAGVSGTASAADPCASMADGMPSGPVAAPLRDGGLGQPRPTCVRSEVSVGVAGRLTADLDNFYGYVPGGLVVTGGGVVGHDVALFGRWEAVRVDLALASLTSMAVGVGPLQLGAQWGRDVAPGWAVGAHGSVVLPTQSALYQRVAVMGVDAGFSASWTPNGKVLVHQGAVVLGQWGMGPGPSQPRLGLDLHVGAELRPVTPFAVVLDLNAAVGMLGGLDALAPSLALRFSDGRRFGFELGARVPVVGDQRELAAVSLSGTARLGRRR